MRLVTQSCKLKSLIENDGATCLFCGEVARYHRENEGIHILRHGKSLLKLVVAYVKSKVGRIAGLNIIFIQSGALVEPFVKLFVLLAGASAQKREIMTVEMASRSIENVSLQCLFNALLTVEGGVAVVTVVILKYFSR